MIHYISRSFSMYRKAAAGKEKRKKLFFKKRLAKMINTVIYYKGRR